MAKTDKHMYKYQYIRMYIPALGKKKKHACFCACTLSRFQQDVCNLMNYTGWNCHPRVLPASVLGRLQLTLTQRIGMACDQARDKVTFVRNLNCAVHCFRMTLYLMQVSTFTVCKKFCLCLSSCTCMCMVAYNRLFTALPAHCPSCFNGSQGMYYIM